MKGKEEDDDSKPNSTNEITQLIDSSAHVELQQQPNYVDSQWMQVWEVAGPKEFSILRFYYMSRSFSERIIFHIGGFWDIYVQIPITMMISIFYL